MSISNEDVKLVSTELKSRFDEFKATNDKRLEAISAEKTKLFDELKKQNEQLSALEKAKADMESEMKSIKRPAQASAQADEHKAAFLNFIKKGDESGLAELQLKAMQTGTDSDGGYAVPKELNTDILSILKDQVVMRQESTIITVGTPEWSKLVNLGGTKTGWVGETAKRPTTTSPTLTKLSPVWGEIYGNPEATQRMLDDSFFNVEQFLVNELVDNFATAEEEAFTLGDGVNKPKGFLSYKTSDKSDKGRDFGTLQEVAAAGSAITADDLIKLVYSQRKVYRGNSKFMLNNQTLFNVRLLKDLQGNYLWQPSIQAGQPSTILGFGVAENEQMPDSGFQVAFGDFKRGYWIFDRIGIRMLRDPYTNKPYVSFYTTKRVGSMLNDSCAIKLLKVAGQEEQGEGKKR